MQEHYYSDNGRQYMVLGEDMGAEIAGYEMRMLFKNRLEVFLPVKEHITNGNVAYEYDITGYTSLEEYGRRKGLGLKEIDVLLTGIERLRHIVSEYMLDVSQVLLSARYIYFNGTDVRFVYYTEKGKDFFTQLKTMWENILAVLDHSDKGLVMKAYSVYQDILTGTFDPDRYEKTEQTPASVQYTSEFIAREELVQEVEVDNSKLKDSIKICGCIGMALAVYGFLSVCVDNINILGLNPWVLLTIGVAGTAVAAVSLLILQGRITPGLLTHMVKENRYIPYQVKEEEINRDNDPGTRLLTLDTGQTKDRNNMKLINKTTGQQTEITKFPAILGTMANCNVILQGDGISRVHAAISRDNDEFVIEDMGSTNGTCVDGEKLAAGKKARLQNGSVIRLAVWDYEIRL